MRAGVQLSAWELLVFSGDEFVWARRTRAPRLLAPLRAARERRILSSVNRGPVALQCRSRVYYSLLVVLLLAVSTLAHGQVNLTVDPAMTKGAAGAPVTIVEFSDYQ
ncbi:MAG: hypothetical protein ACREKS_01420 [Candidatus Rokuibacteriota bacterium]